MPIISLWLNFFKEIIKFIQRNNRIYIFKKINEFNTMIVSENNYNIFKIVKLIIRKMSLKDFQFLGKLG